MTVMGGRRQMGLYTNGKAQDGTNANFTGYSYTNADALSGDGCFAMSGNVRGSSTLGGEYVEVDTSKYYVHSVSVKTYLRSYNNRLGSGHLGFACYDSEKRFISLNNMGYGGTGNKDTYLTRAASSGDTVIYVNSIGGWDNSATSSNGVKRIAWFFSGGNSATDNNMNGGNNHQYSRYLSTYVGGSITQTAQGDYSVTLTGGLSDWGYSYPVGTKLSNTRHGGTYNYCHGAPTYDEEWETFTTAPFTGESRNSGLPFRYGTKYIKFLNLRNYNYRSETGGASAQYYLDNIMLTQVKPPTPHEQSQGHSYKADFADNTKRQKMARIRRFKRKRRGGQKRSDFF
jgi:hypothetical protein